MTGVGDLSSGSLPRSLDEGDLGFFGFFSLASAYATPRFRRIFALQVTTGTLTEMNEFDQP